MGFLHAHILSLMVILPILGAVLLPLMPTRIVRPFTLGLSVVLLFLGFHLFYYFDNAVVEPQFVEKYRWLPQIGSQIIFGVDGLSLLLVILTVFLMPIIFLMEWPRDKKSDLGFWALMLVLESAMIGALVTLDFLAFYIFWELMLIPMYFLIGMWGGKNRIFATMKFFLYTAFGSLLMLVGAICLYLIHADQIGSFTTDVLALTMPLDMPFWVEALLFSSFALAFAIKVPLWPFHTWLPHAHTEAPTPGSVILAGVLLKMGTYGLLRFALPMFPRAAEAFSVFMMTLGVIGIIYGALVAWVQTDAKKLVAYSSISHLGFVVVGSFAFGAGGISQEAVSGAVYQMVNHGISTGILFLLVGCIYERCHTRVLSDFGGFAKQMPVFAICLIIATLGSVGLPGTGGFVGEFLILLGTFKQNQAIGFLAALGVLLGAIYMLKFCKDILFGPFDEKRWGGLEDLTLRERVCIFPLCALVILMGVYPNLGLNSIRTASSHLATTMTKHTEAIKR